MQTREFGCERCWPDDARLAWDARAGLDSLAVLVDESHFIVTILGCPRCRQHYVSVFTETVDWSEGEDPQYWSHMPLLPTEAAGLMRQATAPDEASLGALGPGRRSLRRDHPKDGPAQVSWGQGIVVGPHD